MSSRRGLDCPPAALRLIVGAVVGFGLDVDLQAVRPRAGRKLPVEGRERWAVPGRREGTHASHQPFNQRGVELILDALIKVERVECKNSTDRLNLVIRSHFFGFVCFIRST